MVNHILVYNWARLIFDGTPDRFLSWVERRRPPRELHILPADQSIKETVEKSLVGAQSK
jgi:hypothetical protein